jgi:hypothetical protein
MTEEACDLSLGLIADLQYADKDNAHNWNKMRTRYYRGSLDSVRAAVSVWGRCKGLVGVLQLGDMLDGVNMREGGAGAVDRALHAALESFSALPCTTYHMVGNHDLYNLTHRQVMESPLHWARLSGAQGVEGQLYYSVHVHPRLRLVVLDTYDVGVLGYSDDPNNPHFLQAQHILEESNPNEDKMNPSGLHGNDQRFTSYNGGVSREQLSWLDTQLTEADAHRQNVLIAGQ